MRAYKAYQVNRNSRRNSLVSTKEFNKQAKKLVEDIDTSSVVKSVKLTWDSADSGTLVLPAAQEMGGIYIGTIGSPNKIFMKISAVSIQSGDFEITAGSNDLSTIAVLIYNGNQGPLYSYGNDAVASDNLFDGIWEHKLEGWDKYMNAIATDSPALYFEGPHDMYLMLYSLDMSGGTLTGRLEVFIQYVETNNSTMVF